MRLLSQVYRKKRGQGLGLPHPDFNAKALSPQKNDNSSRHHGLHPFLFRRLFFLILKAEGSFESQ